MKKIAKATILTGLISIMISSTVFANTTDGWTDVGNPIYAKKNSQVYNKGDIAGTNVMDRIRNSYSYKNRTEKIKNSKYMQTEFLIKDNNGNNTKNYTNTTYTNTPSGEIGYTGWYDSPYGVFLDYEAPFASGKPNGIDTAPRSIQQDNIDFNNIQFPNNAESAYIATLDADGGLADAKMASYLGRDSEKYYPIYLNNGSSINSNITSELKRKGTKNLFVLGGSRRFELTAGLTGDFNVIRIGGYDRNETKDYMLNASKKMTEPNRYSGNSEGLVIQGVPDKLQAKVREFLLKEKDSRDSSGIIKSSEFIIKKLTEDGKEIGSKTTISSEPAMVIGVNDGVYEAYWVCYYSGKRGEYVYQYILGNYFPPVPQSRLEVIKSDYKESDSVHWVKPNSQFEVYTEGSVSNVGKDYPKMAELWLHNPKFGSLDNWESAKSQMSTYHQSNSNQFNGDFNKIKDERAWIWGDGGRNCLSAKHYITAKQDNQDYNLLSTVQYRDNWINPVNSGISIKTDGTAPSGNASYDYNEKTLNMKVSINNIIENRSGVKKVWVEYYPKNEPSKAIKETIAINASGKYEVNIDLFDKFGSSNNVEMVVKAEDKVGNVGNLGSKVVVDTFKVEATIERVLAPHNPNFKGGEKGILKIKLYGGIDKYKITFPKVLVDLDKTLNAERDITPQRVTEIEYEFFVPLDAANSNYSVTVDGYKKGEGKSAQPRFDVAGAITEKLRTRIRLPERK